MNSKKNCTIFSLKNNMCYGGFMCYKIAIVGASGLVGQSILNVLHEEGFGQSQISLFCSDESAGLVVLKNNEKYRLTKLTKNSANQNFDFVFISAGEEVSQKFAPIFASHGAVVIDNSNAFRRCDAPLVVPEINAKEIQAKDKIIANPNCSTIQLCVMLDKLLSVGEIKEVVVSTYQAVSGAGKKALEDLKNGSKKVFTHGIKNNVIAEIGGILENGNCLEEDKIIFETKKILNASFDVFATAVRVPVESCHGESVLVEFADEVDIEKVKLKLNCNEIQLLQNGVFYNTDCRGTNGVYVCRLRKVSKNAISMFIMADNLRRGASYNAVKIAEYIAKKVKKI